MVSTSATGKFRALAAAALIAFGAAATSAEAKDFVITLDAGHGGKDYGAVGDTGNEKSITLDVVLALGRLIEANIPETKVVYTRNDDNFVELADRAHIANKAQSDLFMSVHVNSVDKKNRNRRSIAGCQVYTLGLHRSAENLAVAKRENAVMELEPDNSAKYADFDPNSLESDIVFELAQAKRLDQSIEFADAIYHQLIDVAGREPRGVRQAGFWVLWATSMPSVLVELDFICNPTSEQYMLSTQGRDQMVTALYNAFCAYYNTYAPQILGHPIEAAHALAPSRRATHTASEAPSSGEALAPSLPSKSQPTSSAGTDSAEGESPRSATPQAQVPEASATPQASKASAPLSPLPSSPAELYYVQILTSSALLSPAASELKGLQSVNYYKEGELYKYVAAPNESLRQTKRDLKELRRRFPEAFIVTIKDGKRIDYINP